jgi:pyruvate dehydrogenase E1 component beta subunit
MAELTIAQALNAGLALALEEWDEALVMGEDVGRTGGVFRITDGLRDRFGAERVIDTPVAESGIVGVGFGMAVVGMRPILEMQFMGFSYPAFDQVINHVARIRHRSRHRFTAPLVIRIPYGGGIGAAEHHSESAEAIYAHTPGLKVVVPSRPHDAKGLLLAAVEDPDPVIFLEPIRLYRSVKEDVGEGPVRVCDRVGCRGAAGQRCHADLLRGDDARVPPRRRGDGRRGSVSRADRLAVVGPPRCRDDRA